MLHSCIFIAALIVLTSSASVEKSDKNWYKNSLIYHIYPRSFKDSNGDGIGDLNGITSKLEHIADIGADALWLSPIYTSPQVDFGYDVANFTDIDEIYGTLADFDELVAKAKSLGLKVILDFVPNHSSDKHEWFKKSVQRVKPYDEYYVWRDAKIANDTGKRQPPNNWLSVFQGSAWKWNSKRKQYYLHQFAVEQPDLNYHSEALKQEMKNVLYFWMDHGVEGFRMDAINHMYEDPRFLDEPPSNISGLPDDDYDTLHHIYTKNRYETYQVITSWRQVLDYYSEIIDTKMILTEAYIDFNLIPYYYLSGSNVPFNFMFIADLNDKSSAADFKRLLDRWMNNIPYSPDDGYVANWVVGNHDNHRAASRFGEKRVDQLSMLATILPGVSVIYYGDEIGMHDRNFTYEETKDPAGCNAGPERYHLKSRDPERTPFQWDDSTSAGFSTNNETWLPVNSNYRILNLEMQKATNRSHYNVLKSLVQLKKTSVIEKGSLESVLVTEKGLGVVRRHEQSVVALIINFDEEPITVDARTWMNIPENMTLYTSSIHSEEDEGSWFDTTNITIPGSVSFVLVTDDSF